METLLTIIFGILVFGGSFCALSMEYYARKASVAAAPSVPWMRRAVIRRLRAEVRAQAFLKPQIIDLGSGWGTLAIAAAKACPEGLVTGYEISPIPLACSRLRAWLCRRRNVKFVSADMFSADFSGVNVVMAYLTIPLMERLRPKFEAELKPGAVVISNTFPVPGWVPVREEVIQNLVYTLKVFTYYKT